MQSRSLTSYAVAVGAALGIVSLGTIPANATELSLLSGGSGSINGAYFTTTDSQSTGSGVINSFVRLQDTGFEEGYNAGARPVMPDVDNSPTFTRDIQLSTVPIVVNPGGAATPGSYYEFLLDINQSNSNPNLSLDALQVYTKSTPLANAALLSDLTSNATKKYDLDVGSDGNSRVQLNYTLNSGSGSGDLFFYVPVGAFTGVPSTSYVYLYSAFGDEVGATGTFPSNDGFEEWAVRRATTVPDGGTTMAMLGMGLLALEALRRKLKFS